MKFPKNFADKLIAAFLCLGCAAMSAAVIADEGGVAPVISDLGIEGMKSQEFSVAMFYFLAVAIFVFLVFVVMFMLKSKASRLKRGEKWLFAWLLLGVVVAIVFGIAQMLHGYLF